MRVYQQEQFRGLPSNQPLKSPSPDLKGKSSIGPTMSPHQMSIRKSMSQFTPPNRPKKISYMDYSTLPVNAQHQSSIETNAQKIIQPTVNQKQYTSTHAKGHYNFQLPKQLIITSEERYQNDLVATGKKSGHKRNQTHSYIETSPLHQTYNKSHLREDDLMKTINQKDLIIHELKGMINLMTENGKHLKNSQRTLIEEEYESMKNEVKILTIENQKLAELIQRLNQKYQKLTPKFQAQKSHIRSGSKQRSKTQQNIQKSQRSSQQNLQIFKEYQQKLTLYEDQIQSLKTTLHQKETNYEKELDEMIKSHKSLAIECKMYENQKEQFSRQNQRLINLLRLKEKQKQTCYANYSYVDKKQYESQQNHNKPPNQLVKSESGRLSIQKIKAQYEQNLKQYKQNVYNEVYNMFDTINTTLQEISEKINGFDDKLNEMEKFKNSIKSKATSHFTSLQENEQEIKKSAIYIEDPPSSQRINRQSQAREALSVILEESRRDNEKLELQLSHLRREVDMWRNVVKEKSEDNEKGEQYSDEEIRSYQERIGQLQNLLDQMRQEKETSEKEIMRLECEIVKAEENHIAQVSEMAAKAREYEEALRHQPIPEQPETDASLIEELKSQIQGLKEELQGRREEQMSLRQQISQMEGAQQAKEKQLLDQIQQFHATIKEAELNFNFQKEENQEQKLSLLGRIQETERFNRSQAEQVVSLENKLRNKEQQLILSQLKIANLQKEIDTFDQKTLNKNAQIQNQQQKVQTLEKQNQNLKNKLHTDSEKYLFQIHKFTSEFQSQVKQYIQDIESYKAQVLNFKKQTQTYLSDIQNYKKDNEEYQKNIQFYRLDNQNHLKHIQGYKKNHQTYLDQTEAYKRQIEGYKRQIEGYKRQIEGLELFATKLAEETKQKADLMQILHEERQALSFEKEKAIITELKLNSLKQSIIKMKQSLEQSNNLDSIKDYVSQLQTDNQFITNQKAQLISELSGTKQALLQLERTKIELQQKINSLENTVELYKKQLQKNTLFCERYIQIQEAKPAEHQSYSERRIAHSGKKIGRDRIHRLIDQEKHKIAALVSIIDNLSEQKSSIHQEQHLQQEAV